MSAAKMGPKQVTEEPLDLKMLPKSGWRRVEAFAEHFLVIPKGHGARKPFTVEPFQREILKGLFPMRGDRPRQGLVALPRGNGKSTLAALIALYALFADDEDSPQIVLVASTFQQARIVFDTARRMVELSPELSARTKILKDRLVVPSSDGLLIPMAADPDGLQGLDFSLAIIDELHVVDRELWEVITTAQGKRAQSLCLAISTPADSEQSIMWDLVSLSRLAPRKDFFFREWTSNLKHPVDCKHCWRVANPALGKFLDEPSMEGVLRTSLESTFRRLRLGQWLEVAAEQWISPDLWRACEIETTGIPWGADVVLAVDGSFTGDATAIVAASIGPVPHLEKVGLWEPHAHGEGWQVPIAEVEETLRTACKTYKVREINFDPYRWSRTMQALALEGLPILEHPQSPQRMTPSTVGLYEAVSNRLVTHGGDEDLSRHVMNARVTEDSRGTRISKATKNSDRKIDLAVCCVMAFGRASWHANQKPKSRRVVGF